MIHSLVHTSASKTLSGGSGFGVVAQTENFPVRILRIVSNNSGYQFSKTELNTEQNFSTVIFAHWSIPKEDGGQHVLTKISPCNTDPSGRPNRIAQHLIFDSEDMHSTGPALFAKQFNWFDSWEHEPRILDSIQPPSEQFDAILFTENISQEKLELVKLAALGRNSGVALHLSNNASPLDIIISIESKTDSATKWAMYWTINTQRKFTLQKHRLIISTAGNPVENKINAIPIQHITPNKDTEPNPTAAPNINLTPIPPDRSSGKRYTPPEINIHDKTNKEIENIALSTEPLIEEEAKETEPCIHDSNKRYARICEEAHHNNYSTIIAITISAVALFFLFFLFNKSSNQSGGGIIEKIKLQDTTP